MVNKVSFIFTLLLDISTIDGLLEFLGGCGPFQVLAVIILHGSIIASPWAMMFMAYGSYNPGWACTDAGLNYTAYAASDDTFTGNSSYIVDSVQSCDVFDRCNNVTFTNAASTIVTEWRLSCGTKWAISTIISLQMVGVLIGALCAGQLNVCLGRKMSHFGSLLIHAVLHLIASFSVSWQMLATLRFFIGISGGSIMLSGFVYPMEFVTNAWRGVVAALPISSTGSLAFTLTAMWLRDWRRLHQATAILSTLLFLLVFWPPESMRWLALKNKIHQAEKVGLKIAKMNRKPPASMTVLNMIAETERKIEENKPHFTILDLYRHGLLKRTLVITFTWLTNTIIYYTFIYDIHSLSGNFFVNMMLFSAITIISRPFVPLLTNTIGRKWGIISLMLVGAAGCALLFSMNFIEADFDKGLARLVIVLVITVFIDAEWAIVLLYCVELYPTVLRSLSYSHASSVARIGGIMAPFLIPRDESTVYVSQLIMLVLIGVACFSLFLLPETKGEHLVESITLNSAQEMDKNDEEEEVEGDKTKTALV